MDRSTQHGLVLQPRLLGHRLARKTKRRPDLGRRSRFRNRASARRLAVAAALHRLHLDGERPVAAHDPLDSLHRAPRDVWLLHATGIAFLLDTLTGAVIDDPVTTYHASTAQGNVVRRRDPVLEVLLRVRSDETT